MNEKVNFNIPGIEIEKARAEGKEINKANEKNIEKGTGVKGRTLYDAINLQTKIDQKREEILRSMDK